MTRRNVYQRAADRLKEQAENAAAAAIRADRVWAHVAELSREDLFILEEMLQDELHGGEDD